MAWRMASMNPGKVEKEVEKETYKRGDGATSSQSSTIFSRRMELSNRLEKSCKPRVTFRHPLEFSKTYSDGHQQFRRFAKQPKNSILQGVCGKIVGVREDVAPAPSWQASLFRLLSHLSRAQAIFRLWHPLFKSPKPCSRVGPWLGHEFWVSEPEEDLWDWYWIYQAACISTLLHSSHRSIIAPIQLTSHHSPDLDT